MHPFGNFLGDQGGVAAGAIVDDQIDLDLVLLDLVYDLGRVLDHLRIQHAADHFVEKEDPYGYSPKKGWADFRDVYSPMFIFFLDQQNESAENGAGRGWHLIKP